MSSQQYPDPDATTNGSGAGLYIQNGGRAPSQDTTDPSLQEISNYARDPDQSMVALQHGHEGGLVGTPPMMTGTMSSPQRVAQSAVMSLDSNPEGDAPGSPYDARTGNSRKRTKTTRACDECRRKKIRCDSEDGGPEACSSCKRTGAACRFSRTPQKRGPSKGYIKELADRVTSLENLRARGIDVSAEFPHDLSASNLSGSPELSDLARQLSGRKRSHSMTEEQAPDLNQSSQLENADRFNDIEQGLFARNQVATSVGFSEVETEILNSYYQTIHLSLPLLPAKRGDLLECLSECHANVREYFIQSLECAVQHFSPPQAIDPSMRAARVKQTHLLKGPAELALYTEVGDSRHDQNCLIYAIAALLLAIESGQCGPSQQNLQLQNQFISTASSIVSELGSRNPKLFRKKDKDRDNLYLRCFVILYILDRFNAITRSMELTLSPRYDSLLEQHRAVDLGTYHLTRIVEILGNVRENYRSNTVRAIDAQRSEIWAAERVPGSLFCRIATSSLDKTVEAVTSSKIIPLKVIHDLAHQHARLVLTRLSPDSSPSSILSATTSLVQVLVHRSIIITPLNYHFTALAATSLSELLQQTETQEEAQRQIEQLDEAIAAGRILPASTDSNGWDASIRSLLRKGRPTSTGLHHLADAAVERDAKPSAANNEDETVDSANGNGSAPDANDISAMATAAAISASQAHMALQLHNQVSSPPSSWDPGALLKNGITSAFT